MVAKLAVSGKVAVSAAAGVIPAWRGGAPWPVIVPLPTAVAGIKALIPVDAPRASTVRRPLSVVLFLLGAGDFEIC
jgi:hypothetical protein